MCVAALATRTSGLSCQIPLRGKIISNLLACRSPENGQGAAAISPEIAREGEGRWGVYLGMRGVEAEQVTGSWLSGSVEVFPR